MSCGGQTLNPPFLPKATAYVVAFFVSGDALKRLNLTKETSHEQTSTPASRLEA